MSNRQKCKGVVSFDLSCFIYVAYSVLFNVTWLLDCLGSSVGRLPGDKGFYRYKAIVYTANIAAEEVT